MLSVGKLFGSIGVLNTFTKLLHSKIKYKFVFYKVSSPPSPSSLLKPPNGYSETPFYLSVGYVI